MSASRRTVYEFAIGAYYNQEPGIDEGPLTHGALIRPAGWEDATPFSGRRLALPAYVDMIGNLQSLKYTDQPFTDFHPVISKRVWSEIASRGLVSAQAIPVHFLPRDSKGEVNDDYVYLHFLDYADYIDWEASETKRAKFMDRVRVKKLVLSCPDSGFPPIFRVPHVSNTFVNGEVKQALKAMGAKGIRFHPVEVSGA